MADQATEHRCAAEIAVEPFADESIRDELVIQAIDALAGPDVEVRPGLMSTVVTGDIDAVLRAVQRAHTAALGTAGRVLTIVRLESRDGGPDLEAREREISRTRAE
jgi:uncharacterized protein YqgV (UPF0045/DUF77 family)